MRKLFASAPSVVMFFGLMLLCWAQNEYAPTNLSYRPSVHQASFSASAPVQCSLPDIQSVFTKQGSTPISVEENIEDLEENEGKHLVELNNSFSTAIFSSCAYFQQSVFSSKTCRYNKPLYVLFHSWKNHLSV